MIKQSFYLGVVIILLCAAWLYIETMPRTLEARLPPQHKPDLINGESIFWAGGCASCHAAQDAEGDARLVLVGGVELNTPFGIFRSPNISPDEQSGIGKWSIQEFINAMVNGVSPDGKHYYPAFPYANYRIMPYTDLIDLKAFLDTLPAKPTLVADHELSFPFNIRAGLGLWKLQYLKAKTFTTVAGADAAVERGRYLVNGPGHCGACHTPRDLFGGEISDQFLAGADMLDKGSSADEKSDGSSPNITPHADGIGDWSKQDIAYALESGFDPDFDSFGGSMVEVQENMAKLSVQDRLAIAAYLKSIPALASRAE